MVEWDGAIYNPKGLDILALMKHRKETGSITGFEGAEAIDKTEAMFLETDIFLPAAKENVITSQNAHRLRTKILCEGANGPTTPEANNHLHARGVFVVPDILANSAGVTASYFEWVQDRYGYFWTEKEVNERLEAKICEAFNAVTETSVGYSVDMRTAAYIVAINRVATVTDLLEQNVPLDVGQPYCLL